MFYIMWMKIFVRIRVVSKSIRILGHLYAPVDQTPQLRNSQRNAPLPLYNPPHTHTPDHDGKATRQGVGRPRE